MGILLGTPYFSYVSNCTIDPPFQRLDTIDDMTQRDKSPITVFGLLHLKHDQLLTSGGRGLLDSELSTLDGGHRQNVQWYLRANRSKAIYVAVHGSLALNPFVPPVKSSNASEQFPTNTCQPLLIKYV